MQRLVKKNYQGLLVQFTGDGWFNATVVAAKFGKRPIDWLRLPEINRYVARLCEKSEVKKSHFVKTKRGGNTRKSGNSGTWLHPKLGVRFAQWLDIDFAIWCDEQIDKLIRGELDTKRLRHKAASTNKLQNSILQLKRSEQGKPTRFFHYANEARLVNQVLTGDWSGIDRDGLTQAQLDKLAKLEEYNTVLIAQDIEFTPRRLLLRAYADGLGTYSALN
jgi:hypothetical protein